MAALLAVALLCGGCGMDEDPYRVDTVVRIPVDPTDPPAETAATAAPETAPPTEAPTEPTEETEAPPKASGGSKGSSNKNNNTTPKETEPPATDAPETEPETTSYDISAYSVGTLEYDIRDEINTLRTGSGLSELRLDSRLCAIAGCRSWELSQVWDHARPDGRGYATVLEDYGYSAAAVTQLLLYVSGSGEAASIVGKWANSDSHLASLLSDSFSTIGIGVYRAGSFTYVCVLLVG